MHINILKKTCVLAPDDVEMGKILDLVDWVKESRSVLSF